MGWISKYGMAAAAAVMLAVLLVLVFVLQKYRSVKKQAAKEIGFYKTSVDSRAGIYERLFPKELPALLGIRRAEDISTSLQRAFASSVMWVNALDYTKAIHTMTAGELYLTINTVFSAIIPRITESGGIIDRFEKAGMAGLYMENSETALNAAVSMCEAVAQMNGDGKYDGFAIGLAHGPVMVGIVGSEQRIAAVSMSESISLSELLQSKAAKYGAKILASEDFIQRIPGFSKKYNSRVLGYFYDRAQEQAIKIYDIYDGDTPARRQGKRRTRMIFEQGVDRFVHGSYAEARLHFVEVLKADRYDLAARLYLYLCDTYSSGQNIGICIEQF